MNAPTVAALFVEPAGVYAGLPDVDVWDEARDARLYEGPWPVVAHPPCARWSRLAGFTEARFGYKRGDDGGCFEAALRAVRNYGGVLEHPAFSKAWDAYGLSEPLWRAGWTLGLDGGSSCYVEQGRYGLPVKKATWLYAYGVELPELRWGYTPDGDGEQPNGPYGGMDNWRDRFKGRREQWTKGQHRGGHHGLTATTPPVFRDVLLEMARSAGNACPECHGEGRVMVAGYSTSPFSGVLVNDPQEAHDELCDACGGSGDARASSAGFAEARNPTNKSESGAG